MSDRKRILEKIEKLLNFGNDARGNANECASALRQAQKLMEKHGISEGEVGLIGYSIESVDVPIQVNKKAVPHRLQWLVHIIKDAFGVHAVVGSTMRVSDRSYCVHYAGPSSRVMLAVYSHTVVFRALEAAWRDWIAARPHLRGTRGVRAGFEIGWLQAVKEQIEAISLTDDEAAATKAIVAKQFGSLAKVQSSKMTVSADAMDDGEAAGSQFRINKPVGTERLKIGR